MAKEKASTSLIDQKTMFHDRWPELAALFENGLEAAGNETQRERFLGRIQSEIDERGADYLSVVTSLPASAKADGTQWLQVMVDGITNRAAEVLPFLDATGRSRGGSASGVNG